MTSQLAPPVVLVHGWGGSFESTWQRSGFTALLEDAGPRRDRRRPARPRHGAQAARPRRLRRPDRTRRRRAPRPAGRRHRVLARRDDAAAPGDRPAAPVQPDRARRRRVEHLRPRRRPGTEAIVAGLETVAAGGDPSTLENTVRLFTQYASQPGNDIEALTAVMKRPPSDRDHPRGLRAGDLSGARRRRRP